MTRTLPSLCMHLVLRFASGGFFVLCETCGARWKAEVDTAAGPQPDYQRVNVDLDGQERRFPSGTA